MPAGICRFGKSSKSDFVQRGMMGLCVSHELHCELVVTGTIHTTTSKGAVQKEMGSPNYFKFTRELKSAKI